MADAQPTDAEILAAAEQARAVELASGDVRFAQRLQFDWCMRQLNRDPEIVDLSTNELRKGAPNTVATLNRALDLGIRTTVD